MPFIRLSNRYFGILELVLVLLNIYLLQGSTDRVDYLANAATQGQEWAQLWDYEPPDDIGFPEGGEPGGSR